MSNKRKTDKYNLELLFDIVLEKAYKLRKANPLKFDGQGFWQPIKKLLEPLDIYSARKWKKISKTKERTIMLLPEYIINGYGDKIINENNHFIIQQVRIPLTEKPTIKKIVQIALNIGQYKGMNGSVKSKNINDFLYKSDIIELSKNIPDELIKLV